MTPTLARLSEVQFSAQLDHFKNFNIDWNTSICDDLQLLVTVRKCRKHSDDTLIDDDLNERIQGSNGIKHDPINFDNYFEISTL
ncbi:unnamed protein product [Rotaria sp. Silwood2]|nr:unnamed protein product [Rotaria sp. Silwood2]CAF3145902.1 unnamed protein product [Rotaria sp. Silwood2]CAF3461515.1 unnamed protein product [Rotaria sp. Silwood2]CAF4432438.1 unnamed protein product [Rotaria sp. Silwood2]CAF4461800.1 unnamed protein product [Rotaria sp. Silwood2]